jgi:inosose dehydratase
MGTIVETDDEIGRLMAATGDSVGLLFDTGHCLFSGGDPASLLERHLDRIVHFHCKDVRRPVLEKARGADMSFMAAVMEGIFTVPGDGSVDFLSLLRPLAQRGYKGWIVVEAEQDPGKAHPLTYASKGYTSLLATARQAGFEVATRQAN